MTDYLVISIYEMIIQLFYGKNFVDSYKNAIFAA